MKNILIKSHAILLFLVIISSCNPDDFLGIKPRGKDVPTDFRHFDGLFISQNMVKWSVAYNDKLYFPLLSDEFTVTENSFNELSSIMGQQGKNCYTYQTDFLLDDDMPADWGYNSNFYALNLIIENVMKSSGGDENAKLSLLAEARILRSWLLFRNSQIYLRPYDSAYAENEPGLPIITVANTLQETFERVTMKELYDFIIKEIDESCKTITGKTAYPFRIEKADAYAMLGMVYHYMNNYPKALENLDKALQYAEETKSLKFYDLNTMTPATILNDGVSHNDNIEYLRNIYAYNNSIAYYSPYYSNPTTLYAKQKYFNLYSDTDRRKYRFLEENGLHRVVNGDETPMGITSWGLLITLAECEARVGEISKSKNLLEEVRKYRMPATDAKVPTQIDTKEKLIIFCIEENIRENLGNGLLFFEQKRLWNDPLFAYYKADYNHVIIGTSQKYPFTEDQLKMQLPKPVIRWNPNW